MMKGKMDEFAAKVADILEVGEVAADFEFRSVGEWDSMKGFSLMVMIENDYGVRMTIDKFTVCKTVADLARLAGI